MCKSDTSQLRMKGPHTTRIVKTAKGTCVFIKYYTYELVLAIFRGGVTFRLAVFNEAEGALNT